MSPNLLKELEKEDKVEEIKEDVQEETIVEEAIVEETSFVVENENLLKDSNKPLYVPKQKEEKKQEPLTVNLFSASAFEKEAVIERKQLFEPSVEKVEVVEEIEPEEQKIEAEIEQKNEVQEEFFEVKAKSKKKTKSSQFRLKLFAGIFSAVLAVTTGWVIANTVRVANLNNAIESAEKSFSANEFKLINNIRKLTDLDSEDLENNTSLEIIDEVITIQPLPLENPTDYQQTSNFFDALCNWISGLFGG